MSLKRKSSDLEDCFARLWHEGFTPPDRQPVWKRAEEYIESIPYSPIPGRFKVTNSHMLAEVMQEMVNPRTRYVNLRGLTAVATKKFWRV